MALTPVTTTGGRNYVLYLTTHSTHCIYRYMASIYLSKTKIHIGGTKKDYEKIFYLDTVVIKNIKEYKYFGIFV